MSGENCQILENQAERYTKKSDERANTDSQDGYDHWVWPMDPNVMLYKKIRLVLLFD